MMKRLVFAACLLMPTTTFAEYKLLGTTADTPVEAYQYEEIFKDPARSVEERLYAIDSFLRIRNAPSGCRNYNGGSWGVEQLDGNTGIVEQGGAVTIYKGIVTSLFSIRPEDVLIQFPCGTFDPEEAHKAIKRQSGGWFSWLPW